MEACMSFPEFIQWLEFYRLESKGSKTSGSDWDSAPPEIIKKKIEQYNELVEKNAVKR